MHGTPAKVEASAQRRDAAPRLGWPSRAVPETSKYEVKWQLKPTESNTCGDEENLATTGYMQAERQADAEGKPTTRLTQPTTVMHQGDFGVDLVATCAIGFEPTKEESQTMITDVDDDGSGTIGWAEFFQTTMHKTLSHDPKDAILKDFRLLDVDETGKTSFTPSKRAAKELGESTLQDAVDEADRDGDGEVDEEDSFRSMPTTNLF